MLDGLISRCINPTLCAACTALATCSIISTALAGSSGPSANTCFQVAAVDQPHVDIEAAVDLAVIVDGDDVRVVQPGGGVRLPAEPLGEAGVLGQVRRKHLDRHDSVGRGVVGAPYFADAAAAQQLHQPVVPKRRPLHLISKQLWFSKP